MNTLFNVIMPIFLLMATSLDSASAEAPSYKFDCGSTAPCKCAVQLNNIVDGRTVDLNIVNKYAGTTPENMFLNGGSENIPVMCRSVLYLHNHDPSWFVDYFNIQKRPDIRFSNNELFSNTYTTPVVASILVVLGHAIERNDVQLEARASEWLRTYWSYLTLAANYSGPTKIWASSEPTGFVSKKGKSSGLGVAIPGTRSYVNMNRGVGSQDLLLSIALNHPARVVNGGVTYQETLRAFISQQGYSISSKGKVNLVSKPVDPRYVGLTADEQTRLNEFILSNGSRSTRSVLNMLGDFDWLKCNLTFLRTTQGVISWFGTSNSTDPHCSNAKGGSHSAVSRVFSSPDIYFLARVKRDRSPAGGTTWREGNQICSQGQSMPKLCLAIPPGELVNEITIDKHSGVRCVQGNCN